MSVLRLTRGYDHQLYGSSLKGKTGEVKHGFPVAERSGVNGEPTA